jgi:ferritin
MGLSGLAAFFEAHAKEELTHAKYLYDYLLKTGNIPEEVPAVPSVPAHFKSCGAAAETVVAHEQMVTEQISAIATAAAAENDHSAYSAIQFLVDEQVEELDWSSKLLLNIKRAEASNTLHLLDQTYSK